MLASVEAVLAKLDAIWTADDIRHTLFAFVALVGRAHQFPGVQDELVQGSDIILRGALRDLTLIIWFLFVPQPGHLLYELEQRRL
jgi:hypothetical protein